VDEVRDFCIRVLGPGAAADAASREALGHDAGDRAWLLAGAARACRDRADQPCEAQPEPSGALSLTTAVAMEMASAAAELPERQREALALRESLGLSHAEVATVMGIEPAAVAPLLARARLQLRAQRRGGPAETTDQRCEERDRALRLLALRQDSEPVGSDDDGWLHVHLGRCGNCKRAHAAMLEASACYRAWRIASPAGNAASDDAVTEHAVR
jgi:DNA-directed RNA polymerase specialized sigma24 family protein